MRYNNPFISRHVISCRWRSISTSTFQVPFLVVYGLRVCDDLDLTDGKTRSLNCEKEREISPLLSLGHCYVDSAATSRRHHDSCNRYLWRCQNFRRAIRPATLIVAKNKSRFFFHRVPVDWHAPIFRLGLPLAIPDEEKKRDLLYLHIFSPCRCLSSMQQHQAQVTREKRPQSCAFRKLLCTWRASVM